MTNPERPFDRPEHGVQPGKRHRRPYGWRSAEVMRAAALVLGIYLAAQLVWFANPLFLVTFLGILFGLSLSSGVDRLARWRIPRGIGAALIVIGFIAALFGVGAWIAPTIRSQSLELRRRVPEAIEQLEAWAHTHSNGVVGMMVEGVFGDSTAAAAKDSAGAAIPRDSVTIASTLKQRLGSRFSGARQYVFPVITSTIAVVGGIFVIIFLAIYIAADPDLYHRGIIALFPLKRRQRAGEVLTAIATVLRRWLITQLIAMATIGIVTTIVLLVLGVKAPFALGMLAGLFEFIPTVGPILSAVPGVAMGFLDSPEKAFIVAIAYVLIQFLENHLLIPLLMKGGIDVPPVLTILSQALMALTFGFLGLMCAVPLLAATMVAVRMLYVENVVGVESIGSDEVLNSDTH